MRNTKIRRAKNVLAAFAILLVALLEAHSAHGNIPSAAIVKIAGDSCITPPADLVGWWPLDESSGTLAADSAGSSDNNGTHVGGPIPVPGMVDTALDFDGSNDAVVIPDDPEVDLGTGDFTIDAWIKTTSKKSGVQNILDKRVSDGSPGYSNVKGYHFYHISGRIGFQMADANGPAFSCSSNNTISSCTNWLAPASSQDVADGNFHLVAVTVDRDSSSGGRLYVDGVLVKTFNPTIRSGSLSNSANLQIGKRHIPDAVFFNGIIDEVEIFKRALSAAEIDALFQAGSAGKCKGGATAEPLADCGDFPCANNKVELCHVPPGNAANAHTICISTNAIPAHLANHGGDYCGPCNNNPAARQSQNQGQSQSQLRIFPNPSSGSVTVKFRLDKRVQARLEVYDLMGERVATLFEAIAEENRTYTVEFNAENLNGGIYFYRLQTEDGVVQQGRAVILK